MRSPTLSARLAAACLALFLLLVLPGCNRNHKKVIGVVPKGRAQVYWQSVHAGAVKAAREADVELIWNGPSTETDFNAQLQIVDSMINRRVDAIALAPIDRKVMVSALDRAAREGVPVVILDSPVDSDKFVAEVATDNFQAGAIAAERMAQLLGGKGKIVMVKVQPGAASAMAREDGFKNKLKNAYPGIQIVDERYGEADYAKSLRAAENMLTAHPDVNGIFASNESSTVGAAQALKARGSKVKLVGFDAGPALEADLRAGWIDSLVVQQPFQMGYEAVSSAVKHLRSAPVQRINRLTPKLITRGDLDKPEVQAELNPDLKQYLQ